MQLAKISDDGHVLEAPIILGPTFKTSLGVVCGEPSDEQLALESYVRIVEDKPPYDAAYQSLSAPTYIYSDGVVVASYTVLSKSPVEIKFEKIKEVYAECARILDLFIEGYSKAEIALFPLIQQDIVQYQAKGIIGVYMQQVLARGRHTVESLLAVVTPKMQISASALQTRDDHLKAIEAITDVVALAHYDTSLNWPV